MKRTPAKAKKSEHITQYCVRYHPEDAREPRPPVGPLWQAIGIYNKTLLKGSVPTGTAYRTLGEVARDLQTRYPHYGIAVLQDGLDMFPSPSRDVIH